MSKLAKKQSTSDYVRKLGKENKKSNKKNVPGNTSMVSL
jgi:hypothetical protein